MPQYEYCKDLTIELFKKIMGERKARKNLFKNSQNQTLGREIQAYENKAKGQKAFLAERIIKLGDIMKAIDTMTDTLTQLSDAVPFDQARPSAEWNNLQQDLYKMVELKTIADKKKKDLEYLVEFIQPNNRIARFQRFNQAINPGRRLLRVGGNDSLEIVGRMHLGAVDMREAFDKWREYKNSIKSDAKVELFPVWLENLKNWTTGKPSKGVNFFNEDEKRRTAVLFEEGGIMKEIGLSKSNTVDYLDLDTGGKKWAFVIAPDEVVYCYKHMGGKQHHSAALRGGAALCAGKVVAEKGV